MYRTVLFHYYNNEYHASRFSRKFKTIEDLTKDLAKHGDKPSTEIDDKLAVKELPIRIFKTKDCAFFGVYPL